MPQPAQVAAADDILIAYLRKSKRFAIIAQQTVIRLDRRFVDGVIAGNERMIDSEIRLRIGIMFGVILERMKIRVPLRRNDRHA